MIRKHFSTFLLFAVVLVYIVVSYMVLGWGNKALEAAVPEDHYFENVGALSFFAASVLFFLAFRYARQAKAFWIKQMVCLGLALLFFFGAGEEISWGQRILHVATPESIDAVNIQGEINVHNLSFGGFTIPFETFFDLLWISFTVVLPLAAKFIKPFERFATRLSPIVPWAVGMTFLFNYLWAKVAKAVYVSVYHYDFIPFRQAVQEVKEGNYAVLFALTAFFVFLEMKALAMEKSPRI